MIFQGMQINTLIFFTLHWFKFRWGTVQNYVGHCPTWPYWSYAIAQGVAFTSHVRYRWYRYLGIAMRYRKLLIPGIGIEKGYRKVLIRKLVFDTSFSPLRSVV